MSILVVRTVDTGDITKHQLWQLHNRCVFAAMLHRLDCCTCTSVSSNIANPSPNKSCDLTSIVLLQVGIRK